MKSRILIAGGGVAALEAALALRELASEVAQVELCTPREDFVYRPYAVGEPYGAAQVERYDLAKLTALCGARLRLGSIAAVDEAAGEAKTHDGEPVTFDRLVIAAGSQPFWPVPGALTFWGIADQGDVRGLTDRLLNGELGSVVFTMPAGAAWALPLYELALLARTELERAGIEGVKLTVATPEDAPLQVFGRRASEGVAALLAEREIEFLAGMVPRTFAEGRLRTVPGGEIAADAVVSLPQLDGRRIEGVAQDENGFIPIDEHCRVLGSTRLFAAGDVTTFPVKQGGIATQQADVLAAAIAAELGTGVEPVPFDPVLRGVLWTGEESRYLEGWLEGGHGETSTFSEQPPWGEAVGKIVGRHLPGFLSGEGAAARRPGGG